MAIGVVAAELVAERLAFPEGPVALGDGRIAFVQQYIGEVSVLESNKVRRLAYIGGSGNGLAIESDGRALLIAQNGGQVGQWRARDRRTPGICRLDLETASIDYLAVAVDGHDLRSPNDLCSDSTGTVFFTDPGPYNEQAGHDGWICQIADGTATIVVALGNTYPNGIATEPRLGLLWTESLTGRVRHLTGSGVQTLVQLSRRSSPDGMAWIADAILAVATFRSGGITIVNLRSELPRATELRWAPDVAATNCVFDGTDLWVTDASASGNSLGSTPMGRLWRLRLAGVNPSQNG